MDCGPTCLRMISNHYGKRVEMDALREKIQIGKEGVNLLGISEAAEHVGFRTQSVRISLKSLSSEALLPAILHWNQNHFVVLYKVRSKKFYIADPARGMIQYHEREFREYWVN